MSDIAIKLENVTKYYKLYKDPKDRLKEALHPFKKKYHKPFYAIKNLNLEIKKGDVLGVVGRNGCGKSTLLKLITGVLQPNEGAISVKGKITALLELGAGFNPEFTGIDNIQFYAKILGIPDQIFEEKLPSIIAFAELGEFLYQPVKTYSSGMKSRLGFAVAVHVDPEILILDEVLAVGDALFKRKCYAKMEEFFKAGKTIIYVSHDANSVNQLCNRAVLIHEGKILMDAEPKEVTKFYEKLLFSKAENTQRVVAEITKKAKSKNTVNPNNNPVRLTQKQESVNGQEKTLNSYYIKNLKPKSTVDYQNYDINIIDPHITTLEGKRVNVLVRGEEYLYCVNYVSRSDDSFNNVSFGFDVKSETGEKLSSVESVLSNKADIRMIQFSSGETVGVKYKFICLLNVGIYYTNSGLSCFDEGAQIVLNRKVDAMCFKVIQEPLQVAGGKVKLVTAMWITSKEGTVGVSI